MLSCECQQPRAIALEVCAFAAHIEADAVARHCSAVELGVGRQHTCAHRAAFIAGRVPHVACQFATLHVDQKPCGGQRRGKAQTKSLPRRRQRVQP